MTKGIHFHPLTIQASLCYQARPTTQIVLLLWFFSISKPPGTLIFINLFYNNYHSLGTCVLCKRGTTQAIPQIHNPQRLIEVQLF